ncbi:putative KAP-like P-loop ATPase [Chromobacterium alkanivorans]|uniref:KAP family P-loop NTPase fold protein n=1 Tax=Chromobacterium TaxID=535 RepID=UPI002167DA5F|nr:KAP family NTPase [Chromobacterium haemolyticum]MCS3805053.1 putative KAP-like P-loop ATPase [Chromobacterium alkanivorans]MCS3819384.1 putative KAP-like P-loop ATPase [Chromobacterium alkanivorans]MCS3873896.1 putative KAP-like P-loop ATPase [Chromobacterium alkanivorans]MDH0341617.1 KAP family NTPase [Chromobacterium haemolyticum]
MSKYFNDSPIEKLEDDQYGVAAFASALATSLLEMANPVGTTIAINGPWGSGKSSAVNLIRGELETRKNDQLTIVDFKCWWYRGEEAIALAFLQELNTALKTSLGDRVKNLVPEIGRQILQAGPVIGSAVALATSGGVGALVTGSAAFAKRFFPDKASLEKTFLELSRALEVQPRRFLIIIDDIDRLSPDEALAIFRLVKSVGRLPNVMYLLVFDRSLADAAVQERYPSEGPHFLEKIIQASFELPPPAQSDLNSSLLTAVQDICGAPSEQHVVRFMNLFYDVVVPYMTTPRHITRLINAMSVTWPAVADNISRADYLALETLRLYEPTLYNTIKQHREIVTGSTQSQSSTRDDSKFSPFLSGIPGAKHESVKVILQRLFPSLENITYSGFHEAWDAERRVCLSKHFDTYFRLSLSNDTLSATDIGELLQRANDREFVKGRLLRAAEQIRKDGKSMVPVVLDELTSHGKEVERDKVQDLFYALFQVADSITRKKDGERGFAMANTHLRLHWLIRRVTEDRFSLEEKSALYLAATEEASLGWLVEFVSSAINDYHPRDGQEVDPTRCLVTEDAIPIIKERALNALRHAANIGTLLRHDDLMFNLYRWRDFSEDGGTEVKTWLAEQLQNDEAVIIFAKALTGESWTTGLGGFGSLGDRVSRRQIRAKISDNFDLFDLELFRDKLERILREQHHSKTDLEAVRTFLEAWRARRDGFDG